MRIGIAARGLSEKSGGVKQYISSLISALLEIDKGNEYYLFYNSPDQLGRYPSAHEIYLKFPTKFLWDHVGIPYLARKHNVELLFCPKNVIPFFIGCKTVVTILDMTHFKFPDEYRLSDKYYMRLFVPHSIKSADRVIAISENTKKDIVEILNVRPDKVSAIPLAPDKKYKPIFAALVKEKIKIKYGIDGPFIFFPGVLSPRKNMITLVKAFNKIKNHIPHKIVFTAERSWKDSQVYRTIEAFSLQDRIVTLGHIEASDMPVFYNLAELLVYPSKYEGFGLPAIEAMACGCPVISSNSSSLPEVVGDAAMTLNYDDVDGFASAILKVLTDSNLRENLIQKGFIQAAKFSWNKTAEKTLDAFRAVQKNQGMF